MNRIHPPVVDDYLSNLAIAVNRLPPALGREIYRGVAEELDGLDDAEASSRVAELGDVDTIVSAALDGADRTEVPVASRRGFAVTGVGVLSVVGLLIPVLGWIVGVLIVWISSAWGTRQKVIATLITPAVSGVIALIVASVLATITPQWAAIGMWDGLAAILVAAGLANLATGIWLAKKIPSAM